MSDRHRSSVRRTARRTSTSRASSGSRTARTTDTDQPILTAAIAARWVAVRRRIEAAAEEAGRDPSDVRMVAVTKGFGPEVVRAALAAGLSRFGENRVQEGESKLPAAPDAEWHLIGHLQSNKARRAVAAFGWLHGIDSMKLLHRVDEAAHDHGARPRILLQLNVTEAGSQHGL
ncbi:MAG TPA: alanine racemase, partial [Candidatus Limnocylindria bacterium]|nr:alanine racemase [Candidatus Limnocylindria bacterium]